MDPISAVLDGPRARGAFLLRTVLAPPWSLRIEDRAPLTVISLVRGAAWIVDDGCGLELAPGDVALIRGPEPYVFADDPGTMAQIRIDEAQHCWAIEDGRPLADEMRVGIRTWGNTDDSDERATVALVGAYDLHSQVTPLLLGMLPRVVHIPAPEWSSPARDLLLAEIGKDAPGQVVVLDRLLDLVLVEALRHWFTTRAVDTPSWWSAAEDPMIGPALRALQDDPAGGWSVELLARTAGLSRAAFARRFHDLVGVPPMTFLTRWRLSLAADLLRDTGSTIAAIARDVGYGSPFALSAAFTREHGMSPTAWRRQARGLSDAPERAGTA